MSSTGLDSKLAPFTPLALSAFRIVFGLLFTVHGTQKLFGFLLLVFIGGGSIALDSVIGRKRVRPAR